jgi:hypothetical protein
MTSAELALHGSLVLMASLLFGAPYARAIKRQADPQVTNSWRVAHQSLAIGALLLFALAAIQPFIVAPAWLIWCTNVLFVVSGYAFTVATPLAAVTKDRGLSSGSTGLARWVYLGNMVGALTSLVGGAGLVFALGWTVWMSR